MAMPELFRKILDQRKEIMDHHVDAFHYLMGPTFPKVIIIDVAMPHIFTKQQFEMAFKCIINHQKQILAKFGWISPTGKFLCKNLIETHEPVNKQGKDFIRYTAIRR